MTEFRTKGKGSNRVVYPISPRRSKRKFKTIKTKKGEKEKRIGIYRVRKCRVCGNEFLLGPADPDVHVCPVHAYEELAQEGKK